MIKKCHNNWASSYRTMLLCLSDDEMSADTYNGFGWTNKVILVWIFINLI